jgi:hypothetical protein
MSYTEFHTGTLEKVDFGGDFSKEEQIKTLKEECYKIDVYDDYIDIYDSNLVYINDEFYRIKDHFSGDDSNDIAEGYLQPDGTIKFIAQFYNGGCGLEEVLADIVNKTNKEDNAK